MLLGVVAGLTGGWTPSSAGGPNAIGRAEDIYNERRVPVAAAQRSWLGHVLP